MGYWQDVQGIRVQFSGGARDFFFPPQRADWLWDPLRLLSNGYKGLLPLGVKWLRYEADHSLPFRANIKNNGAMPPLPIHLHGVVLNEVLYLYLTLTQKHECF
jgi:hypothetical protein